MSMTKDEVAEVAREAARAVLAKREELFDEEFDTRYHDVDLLMKNYRKLKAHYAHVSPEALEVNAICSMRRKTGLMMSHVDKMLTAYEAMCRDSSNPDELRRWTALYMRFIDPEKPSINSIVEQLCVDRSTFFRDINKAKEDMAVLLFGIEAIGSWKHKK